MSEQLREENKLERTKRLWDDLIRKLEECEDSWVDLTFLLSETQILDNLNIRTQKLFNGVNARGKDFYWFLEKLSEQRERSFDSLLQGKRRVEDTEVSQGQGETVIKTYNKGIGGELNV